MMKTKLLLAAAVAALSIGATGAQAAPAVSATDVVTQGGNDSAVQPAYYGYRYYYYGYYYYPYYYYRPYYYRPYYDY